MKFQAALLALCLSGSSAFAPQTLNHRSSSLYASPNPPPFQPGTKTPPPPPPPKSTVDPSTITNIWNEETAEAVQGSSLRTWSFMSNAVERVQVLMKTEGRPLNADVELWQGPDNSPQKMSVYLEDGDDRTFSAIIESPRGSNTVAIRNTANLEFPLLTTVEPDILNGQTPPLAAASRELVQKRGKVVQGGAIMTYPFDPTVQKVSIVMKTDGRPLNARLELLQGPNNNKQVVDVYTEDGMERPFIIILDTPGTGNVVRIINTSTVEFPLTATVEPFLIENFTGEDALSQGQGSLQRRALAGGDFFAPRVPR